MELNTGIGLLTLSFLIFNYHVSVRVQKRLDEISRELGK